MRIDWNAVAKVGIPGVIACFLVYNLAQGFDKFDARLHAVEVQHQTMATHSERTEDLMARTYMANQKLLNVVRQLCVQDAKTLADRRECLKD